MSSNNFEWLNEESRLFLSRGYLPKDMKAENRIWDIASHAENILRIEGFANKFYDYMSRGWYSLASPIWSNYGTNKGLSVSCFGSYISDSTTSILDTHKEVGLMSKMGGGTSGTFDALRPRGSSIGNSNGESYGPVHFMEMFDTLTDVISQGGVRKGAFSPYLSMDHPDIEEFIGIGSDGHPIQGLTHGVVVTDSFIEGLKAGDKEKRRLWAKVIENRGEVGYPYIFFKDNVNNNKVDVYKDTKQMIHASNLCSEICLNSNEQESFVCVLSSMNLLHYDEWKDTDAVETMVYFLDSVVTEFLNRLDEYKETDPELFNGMKRAYNFAKNQRALGLGVLGWHSYLQSNHLPFDSQEAAKKNLEIAKLLKQKSYKASEELAEQFGEPELLKGYGRRNTTLLAIAPTKSSSFILGQVSQSIEPEMSNYYVKDVAKSKITVKNKYLKHLLQLYAQDTREVWESIREADGSVQHLDFMTDEDKEVFKTFGEIDPYAIINQAAVRQQYIDQSQSLNLMIGPSMTAKEINQLYLTAHEMGIKTLYYQFSTSAAQELARNKGCQACEA